MPRRPRRGCCCILWLFLLSFAAGDQNPAGLNKNTASPGSADADDDVEYVYDDRMYQDDDQMYRDDEQRRDTSREEEEQYEYSDMDYEETDSSGLRPEVEGSKSEERLPVFTSKSVNHLVGRGNTARLNCSVDSLGSMVLSWKKMLDSGPTFLSMGDTLILRQPRLSLQVTPSSSTLTLALVEEGDTGAYLCEVSSQPPITQQHRVEIRPPAQVSILRRPPSGKIELKAGERLLLECKGHGDPAPSLQWSRDSSRLPDGSTRAGQAVLDYLAVDRKHAGTYTCTGDNGFGEPSRDSVLVQVKHSPVLYLSQAYVEDESAGGVPLRLELTCVVQAYPEAVVSWSRSDRPLERSRSRVEVSGHRHVLLINSPTKEDVGIFTCTARNSEAEIHAVLQVTDNERLPKKEPSDDQVPDWRKEEAEPELEQEEADEEAALASTASLNSASLTFLAAVSLSASLTFLAAVSLSAVNSPISSLL